MPISIEDYQLPEFVRMREKKPFSESNKDKFLDALTANPTRSYRSDSFPQPGYNPSANRAKVPHINLNDDDLSLPPY